MVSEMWWRVERNVSYLPIRTAQSSLGIRDHSSPSQVETIATFQEVVRLAVMLLPISDRDPRTRAANHLELIPVHDDRCARVHADA